MNVVRKGKHAPVHVSEHAIDRWCERVGIYLDASNPNHRDRARKELTQIYQAYSKFVELQESGRRLYVHRIKGDKSYHDIYIVVDQNELVTCWVRERPFEEIQRQKEIENWEAWQLKKRLKRLLGSRVDKYHEALS